MAHHPTLTIHLSALVQNWQSLRTLHGGRDTAAVVKADAYGLGAASVVQALQDAGCRRFFVATLQEAIALRVLYPHTAFYIFQGILKGEEKDYLHYGLHPVINNIEGLQRWLAVQNAYPNAPVAAIHIDSGMNRLGLSLAQLHAHLEEVRAVRAELLMTHYACASTTLHPLNAQQYTVMQQAHALLPHLTSCYANSAGHFLPPQMQGEVSRPGCALYGINPLDDASNPMQPVCTLTAPILQMRTVEEAMPIGYGATETLPKGARLLTAGIGYADGIHRHASHGLMGFIGGESSFHASSVVRDMESQGTDSRLRGNDGIYTLPLIGRVTMDMLCFDATHVPDSVLDRAEAITLMDATHQTVDDLARIYGTIGYEVLTSLGTRVKREYVDE
jgi:alanine racemase